MPVSGAAFSKAREKIQYTAIEEIFEETALRIPTPKKFKGYQVIAIDGMNGEMPKTPELMEKYCPIKDGKYPMFHSIEAYDVLNELYLAADFVPSPANEHKLVVDLLDHPCFHQDNEQILLLDRGFPILALIQMLDKAKKKYVMRVSSSFLKLLVPVSSRAKLLKATFDKFRHHYSNVRPGRHYPRLFSSDAHSCCHARAVLS